MNTTNFIKTMVLSAGLFCAVHLLAFEKVGVTSFQFLKVIPDARSTGLGEAYSSVATGADGLFWNPAAMMTTDHLSIHFSRVDYIFDTGHYSVAGCYRWHGMAFGAMFMNVDYGSLEVTTVNELGYRNDGIYNPGLTGEVIQPGALVAGIGFAQRLTDKFSYGITSKFVREDMSFADYSLYMWDMGILYDTGFRSVRLAATMRNFGPQVKYFDYSYPLPQTMNIGISANLWGKREALFFTDNRHQLLVTFDLVQPRDYDQQYNAGIEYVLLDLLALRAGYKMNYDTEGLTLGAGLRLKGFGVDYSYVNYGAYLSGVQRFSLTFNK